MSVPSTSDVQATFAATLVDEWIRHGLSEAVICPGSRSTPLALALSRREEITVHVRIDERSAGFFALGCSLRSARATLVLVTSGTAAAELHACVAEADLAHVALIVVTADRPPELHGVGAAQTIVQRELFGSCVRRFEEPGVARLESAATWRALASRIYRSATGEVRGPVHLNAAFVEPLIGRAQPLPPARDGVEPWVIDERAVTTENSSYLRSLRPVLVVGAGADPTVVDRAVAAKWIVLGDATCQNSTPYFDAILRSDVASALLAPDLVVRLGSLPASKVLQQRLAEWNCRVLALSSGPDVADPDGRVHSIHRSASTNWEFDPDGVDATFATRWRTAVDTASEVMVQFDDPSTQLSEPSLARCLVALSASAMVPLVVGSSMPVRDIEWFAPSRTWSLHANRGANGIDGVNSTVLGVGAGGSAIGYVGDVTFLHDVSALTDGLGTAGGSCALVVALNGGGGIFSFLAPATELEAEEFSTLFATPRPHDLVAIAAAFGHATCKVSTNGELNDAVEVALRREGVTVIVAEVPHHSDNVILHGEINELISRLVQERLS